MLRRFAPFVFVVFLAACGGGTGGSSSPGTSSLPAPSQVAPAAPSQSVQRAVVQQALTSTQQSGTIASYGSSSGSSPLGLMRHVAAGERAMQSVSACTGGVITSTSPGNASNVTLLVVNGYYDLACTKLWISIQLVATNTAPGAGTAVGNATTYSLAGTPTEFDALSLAISGIGTGSGYFSLRDDVAANASSPAFANVGVGCAIAPASDACSLAAALHIAGLNLDDAAAATVSGQLSTTTNGFQNVALSGNGTAVAGPLNSTNITPTGAYQWATTGGTQVDAATLNGTLTYSPAGLLEGGSLTLADAADGLTGTAAYSASTQTIIGSVYLTAGNVQVATYSVNLVGTGTVAYSNGSVGTIANWAIQG